jgi:hypothetical protein
MKPADREKALLPMSPRMTTMVMMRTPRRSMGLRSAQRSRMVYPSMSEPAKPMA